MRPKKRLGGAAAFALEIALALAVPALAADPAVDRWHPYGPPAGALLDLVAGPGGRLFVAAEQSGVYASGDGGRTWSWSGQGMGNQRVRALAADPEDHTLYAVGDSRVFRSSDSGASWQPLSNPLPIGPPVEK